MVNCCENFDQAFEEYSYNSVESKNEDVNNTGSKQL